MITFLKELFCKHEYILSGQIKDDLNYDIYLLECKKCGKRLYTKFKADAIDLWINHQYEYKNNDKLTSLKDNIFLENCLNK